ncbi:hypothetical protein TTHERM_000956461 (macronuclear) [Tetrahymena thermophila SB210]|uniref:Uncharacterized protein n=1 Tax=Tetrahymena thermophila (strain SB210) TaxID=312017 RepID=W7XGF5_TETTS|nr:hypothetical protein TTHERM_000956461 [Tetrahymena thermophila SB210]EWS73211.1 hypothetical protein TTHERM_000956461 [Tetrahymena thermophila SB210]|eukprot:XP_012654243.1 hypothetical protein TTHERM_000956461 [Tetrahymena thermophila SB210]
MLFKEFISNNEKFLKSSEIINCKNIKQLNLSIKQLLFFCLKLDNYKQNFLFIQKINLFLLKENCLKKEKQKSKDQQKKQKEQLNQIQIEFTKMNNQIFLNQQYIKKIEYKSCIKFLNILFYFWKKKLNYYHNKIIIKIINQKDESQMPFYQSIFNQKKFRQMFSFKKKIKF